LRHSKPELAAGAIVSARTSIRWLLCEEIRVSAKSHPFRRLAACLTATSFLLAQLPSALAQTPAETPASNITIQECQNLNDPDVRAQIRALTEAALTRELGEVDYAALVDKHWREVKMSERLDVQIDEAIGIVRADTNILDRAYSTVSRETAEKTAIAVAERAYGSEGFRAAMADLAQGVGADFGARIEGSAAKVAGPVIACVRTALQSRYGGAVAQVFARETEGNLNVSTNIGSAKIDTGDLLLQNTGTISGIVLIVSRRIIGRMVATIGRRVAGLVASRIISTFTGLIGLALIARDVYEASEGVFPLIAERMKSDEAKDLIKQELTQSIRTDLGQQISTIADETTDRIDFLKNRTVEQLGRLGRLVGFLLGEEQEAGVLKRTRDGSLGRALLDLDDTGVAIAIEMKSLDKALAWAALAGTRLSKAVEYGLPQIIPPDEINADQLSRILDFDSRAAAQRIAQLDRAARDALLSLPSQTLKDLARRLSESDLAALAAYQNHLDTAAAQRVLREVVQDPGVMRSLGKPSIQNAILQSRDQLSAVTMLLRQNSTLSFGNIGQDLSEVRMGDVNYRVFVERYWSALLIVALLVLLLLVLLKRILFGRPPTVVIKHADGGRK
jgi:hypothetical protein